MTDQCQRSPQTDDDAQQQRDEQLLQSRVSRIRHKLLVLSGKGGVGKSTVAANLAVSLAKADQQVGLLDIDVHGPSIPKLLGLVGRQITGVEDGMLPVRTENRLAVMSIGFLLGDRNAPVIWRGPMKHGVIRRFLQDVAWGPLDYLVVDSPPGTGDEPLSVTQLVGSGAGAVIVTTPQDLAVADVRRCISFCNTVKLPVVGIVENMSGLVCPKCGERIDVFKTGGGRALADEMDVPFLGSVPIDPQIVASGDAGEPFAGTPAPGSASEALANIVSAILAHQEQQAVTTSTEEEN